MKWRELDRPEREALEDEVRMLAQAWADRVMADPPGPARPYDGPPEVRAAGLLAMMRAADAIGAAARSVIDLAAWQAGQTGATSYAELGEAVGITRQSARERWPDALPADRRPGRRAAGDAPASPDAVAALRRAALGQDGPKLTPRGWTR
ncbi:hypothetical protein [Actinomadura keratinilytica]|uniref:hypothetical protein n=1 Tax=Actinomadura keratinilytica TaxID=547461 RepID=UPI0031E645ED